MKSFLAFATIAIMLAMVAPSAIAQSPGLIISPQPMLCASSVGGDETPILSARDQSPGLRMIAAKPRFSISTFLTLHTSSRGRVVVELFNSDGKQVALLLNDTQPAGTTFVPINAVDLPAGNYIAIAISNGESVMEEVHVEKQR